MNAGYIAYRIVTAVDEWATGIQLAIWERKGCLVTLYFHHLYANEVEMQAPPNLPQERITVADFRIILGQFASAGYHFTSPPEILSGLNPKERHVLVTFDDGYADNLRALPVLEAFNATATVFVSAHHARDQKGFWTDVLWRHRRSAGASEMEIATEIDHITRTHREKSETHVRHLLAPMPSNYRMIRPGR